VYINNSKGICLGISSLYISYFNQINPLPLLPTHSLSQCFTNTQKFTIYYVILYLYISWLFQYFYFPTFVYFFCLP
jgi:hypothetical protein